MFATALIGLDLSEAEYPVLECVADLESWGIQRVVLTHVIHLDYGRFSELGHADRYRDWLEERAAPLRAAGLTVETSVTASGRPVDELLARAAEHDADLIVVGSRSHQLVERLFLGSVVTEVVHTSDIPVLVERLEPDPDGAGERCLRTCDRTLDRVLLATDLSEASTGAEQAAVHLAGPAGSVDCLTVVDEEGRGVGALSPDHVEAALASIQERVAAAGGSGVVRIERGVPRERIPELAAEGSSMVVVGKHRRGRIAGAVSASTAERVAEITGVPVLVVPA